MTPAERCTAYLAAFATGDPDAVVAHVSDDFVNEHTAALGSGCIGRDEYARRVPGFLASMPGLRYEVEDVVADGERVVVAYTLHTHVNDRDVAVRGVMRFRVEDDLIAHRDRLLGQPRVPAAGGTGVSLPTRRLGHSGIEVTTIAFGAMMFGRWGNTDVDECHRMVDRALDAGITLFDTADMYDDGASETILGEALRGRRDQVVLATKVGNPMGDDPQRSGLSRRWITQACDDSLRRLQVDHIDLYQMHRPDPADADRRDARRVRRAGHGRQGAARSARRRSRPHRSTRSTNVPTRSAWRDRRASSRRTRHWRAGSSTRCCRRAAATTSASSCGRR